MGNQKIVFFGQVGNLSTQATNENSIIQFNLIICAVNATFQIGDEVAVANIAYFDAVCLVESIDRYMGVSNELSDGTDLQCERLDPIF